MNSSIRYGLVSMSLVLWTAQVQGAVDARIKQIRHQSNQTTVIQFETPVAPASTFGVAAVNNKASALDKARQLLNLSHIRPQLLRGAVDARRASAAEDYSLINERSSANAVRFQRTLNGIAVHGEEAIVDFDVAQNARQIVFNARNGQLKQNPSSILKGSLLNHRAKAAAARLLGADARLGEVLLFWVGQGDGDYSLQYRFEAKSAKATGKRYRLWMDAQNGQVLRYYTLDMDARNRTIYDLQNQNGGDATLVKTETGNVAPYSGGDTTIENLYQYLGNSYDYFWTTFGRDSFDGNGATVMAIAHMGQNFNNAFWCGCDEQYFGFGDGDGINFTSFAKSRHVVAHEFTHAVTQNTANLEYYALSGALNEAMSDMFGKMIEAQQNSGAVPDWLVGKEIVGPQFGKPALRDMKNPHQGPTYNQHDPFAERAQPEHLDELYLGGFDSRGVHINSSLPNKMLQMLVEGGTHRSVSVTALPLGDINKLLYNTLTAYLTATSDLYAFSDGMRNACQVLSGTLQTPMANCQASVSAAAQSVGLISQNLNFSVRLAGVRQLNGNNNGRLDNGEQFELVLDVFNKGIHVPHITVSSTVVGGSVSFDPLNYSFTGNNSFTDRYRIGIIGNVNQAPATNTQVTLYITATGFNPQQVVFTLPSYGVFDPVDHVLRTYNVPSVYDLDGDGVKEIVSIDGTRNKLTIHNAVKGWQASTDISTVEANYGHSAFQVAIDDFGVGDVRIVSLEDFGRVSTYNAQGVRLHSFGVAGAAAINFEGSPSPVIADLDGDGSKEIILVTPALHSFDHSTVQNTQVYVFDKNLNVKSGWPRAITNAVGLAVADLDADGKKDIVISTYIQVIAINHLGQNKAGWPWSVPVGPAYPMHPVLADVNNDGKPEIFLGDSNNSKVYALQANGTALSGFPKTLPDRVTADRVIPADIDGDGQYELVLGGVPMGSNSRGTASFNTNTRPAVMSMSGTILNGWPKTIPFFSPLIADVSGDGRLDIVGADHAGLLHAYSINGVEQPGFPMDIGNGWRNTIGGGTLGDANGDGLLDLVYAEYNPNSFGAGDGFGLLHLKQPYNPAKLYWAMPDRTVQNTGAAPLPGLATLNYRGTTNTWGLTPMRKLDNNLWSVVVTIPGTTTDRFKLDASTTWALAYGDTNRDGIAAVGEADIYFNKPAGTYVIKFNDQTRAYSITPSTNQAPVVNAGGANANTSVNQALSLDGSASFDPDGGTISCIWSEVTATGEQTIGSSCVSSRTFSTTGSYLIKLLVTDAQGLTATAYKTVTVTAASTWQRTVIFVQATTSSGQDMFIRGGIDHAYAQSTLGRSCTQANMLCAVPIRHRNLKNATTNPWKTNDNYLDWYGFEPTQSTAAQGTPLDWTTSNSAYSATVAVQGYGYTPLNTWGDHQWMLDVDMDCSKTVNGWFELKSFISNGPGWEANVTQAGTPYVTGNHFGQCGKLNRFISGQGSVSIQNLP